MSFPLSAEPLKLIEIDNDFVLSGRIAHRNDISGITKVGDTGILVSDEDSEAQILKFESNTAKIVSKTPLLSSGEEADLEGVAFAKNGWLYATGSHGVTKKKSRRAPSREQVFRFKLSPENLPIEKSTASLSPHLLEIPELRPAIGRALDRDGLNIEGLATIDDTLYFGLRRPNIGKNVLIVEISASTLFDGAPGSATLHQIPASPGNEIRALEPLLNGDLLILLSGKKKSNFITLWNAKTNKSLNTPISVPASKNGGKAESIFIIDPDATNLTFTILYDSIPGGGARTFQLTGAR